MTGHVGKTSRPTVSSRSSTVTRAITNPLGQHVPSAILSLGVFSVSRSEFGDMDRGARGHESNRPIHISEKTVVVIFAWPAVCVHTNSRPFGELECSRHSAGPSFRQAFSALSDRFATFVDFSALFLRRPLPRDRAEYPIRRMSAGR